MSGLFTRLAQQSINQHKKSIEPMANPVFPSESIETLNPVNVPHQESVQTNVVSKESSFQVEPNQIKLKHQEIKDTSATLHHAPSEAMDSRPLLSNPPLRSEFLTQKEPVTQQAKVKDLNNRADQSVKTGHVIPEVATIQPQIKIHSKVVTENVHQSEATVPDVFENKASPQEKPEAEMLPQSIAIPMNDKFPAMASHPGNKTQSSKINRQQADAQPTTINVSIGQIDIKATSPSEIAAPKQSHQSNRRPSVSLDDYQRQRQQGER
jgi:hypothetical protein